MKPGSPTDLAQCVVSAPVEQQCRELSKKGLDQTDCLNQKISREFKPQSHLSVTSYYQSRMQVYQRELHSVKWGSLNLRICGKILS
jgi:hypothetical protein